MARGIIYVMKTVVPGLIKIGKTNTNNFESRMYQLEHHGYNNVTGLKRVFAIEVEEYDEKESMLDDIFSRSCVPNSELFALDIDLVVQLLASFEGEQVYPKPTVKAKETVFQEATADKENNHNQGIVPDGIYHMSQKVKSANKVFNAEMHVIGGRLFVPALTEVCLIEGAGLSTGVRQLRDKYVDESGLSTEDVEFSSPSSAGSFVTGASCNGWSIWKTDQKVPIDVFRQEG